MYKHMNYRNIFISYLRPRLASTHSVAKDNLELLSSRRDLPSARIPSMCHHTRLLLFSPKLKVLLFFSSFFPLPTPAFLFLFLPSPSVLYCFPQCLLLFCSNIFIFFFFNVLPILFLSSAGHICFFLFGAISFLSSFLLAWCSFFIEVLFHYLCACSMHLYSISTTFSWHLRFC